MIDYDKLQIGDVFLTKKVDRPIIDALIWFFQKLRRKPVKSPMVSHSAAYLGEGEIIEAHAFGVRSSRKIFSHELFQKYNVYVMRAKSDFDKAQWRKDCIHEIGVKYAYKQIFYIAYKKLLRLYIRPFIKKIKSFFPKSKKKRKGQDIQDDAFTCSEFLSYIFRKHGIKIHPRKIDAMVFPIDIYESEEFEEVMRHIIK